MTDPNYQHDIFIIDRSGSMEKIREGTQAGIDEFIVSQAALKKNDLKITASLWQFDDEVENIVSMSGIEELGSYLLLPRNWTALWDAVGMAVTAEGQKLAALPENQRPRQVVVVIASDGLNNRSKEYTGPQVSSLLKQQREVYGWQVLYLGTNQDAFEEAAKIGINPETTIDFMPSNAGVKSAFRVSAAAVNRYSMAAMASPDDLSVSVSYTDEERKQAIAGDD